MTYRPDIDGLRAIAVLAIVLYHIGFNLPGGYVGVDVFFVISGYLITSMILNGLEYKTFSLTAFWERRLRRLFPAAFVMIAFTLVIGYWLMLPSELTDLAKSAMAQIFISSNIYFFTNTGYFDAPVDDNPLLHTWALSIEEQFYVLLPFIMTVLWRRLSPAITAMALLILGIISFVASVLLVNAHSQFCFYLLPTRAWEFVLGAILVFNTRTQPGRAHEFLSILGLGFILYPIFTYDQNTTFPGINAFIPCIGTMFVIYSNTGNITWVGKTLSFKPLVFIGLISYSLYLWHWPIVVYANYILFEGLSYSIMTIILVISLAIAYLSWKYIENPIRARRVYESPKKLVRVSVYAGVLIMIIAGLVSVSNRSTDPVKADVGKISIEDYYTYTIQDVRYGMIGEAGMSPDFILWGDSHALAVSKTFDNLAMEYAFTGCIATKSGVLPLLDTWRPSKGREETTEYTSNVIDYIINNDIKTVVLVGRWTVNVAGRPDGRVDSLITDRADNKTSTDIALATFKRSMPRTIDRLNDNGINVWVLKQVPLQPFDVPKALNAPQRNPVGVTLEEHLAYQFSVNTVIDNVNAKILDPAIYLFDANGKSILEYDGYPLYRDDDHLSRYGAEYLRDLFVPIFESVDKGKSYYSTKIWIIMKWWLII